MSEAIRMNIEIGGTLPFSLIDKLLELINEDMFEISDGYTKEEMINQDPEDCVFISGTAKYGMCTKVFAFCEKNDLTYVHHVKAQEGFNAATTYWEPGFEETKSFRTDSIGNAIIVVHDIKPLLDLMCAFISLGNEALPLFLNDSATKNLAKIALDNPEKFSDALKKEINNVIPDKPPKVPPFIFNHSK